MKKKSNEKKHTRKRKFRGNGKKEDDPIPEIDVNHTDATKRQKLNKTQKGGSKKTRSDEIEKYREIATKNIKDVDYDYDVEYDPMFHPAKVIEVMGVGASREELPIELGIMRHVLIAWFILHKEFRDAVTEGDYLALGWWKRQGRVNIFNPYFNNSLYTNEMANRFLQNKKKITADNLLDEGYENAMLEEADVTNLSDEELEAKLKEEDGKKVNRKRTDPK